MVSDAGGSRPVQLLVIHAYQGNRTHPEQITTWLEPLTNLVWLVWNCGLLLHKLQGDPWFG